MADTAVDYTPAQRDAMARRLDAAENLERARQVIRENNRYGYPVTVAHREALHAADLAYDRETRLAGWPVIQR